LYWAIIDIINQKTKTGWTTRGHVADDVAVISYGKNSELFLGVQDNTEIAKKLLDLVK
jgi:alkaline phosphatase